MIHASTSTATYTFTSKNLSRSLSCVSNNAEGKYWAWLAQKYDSLVHSPALSLLKKKSDALHANR
jgi:hypothetical protein